jgi:hypothetical protein
VDAGRSLRRAVCSGTLSPASPGVLATGYPAALDSLSALLCSAAIAGQTCFAAIARQTCFAAIAGQTCFAAIAGQTCFAAIARQSKATEKVIWARPGRLIPAPAAERRGGHAGLLAASTRHDR